jgi:hypothetical protein
MQARSGLPRRPRSRSDESTCAAANIVNDAKASRSKARRGWPVQDMWILPCQSEKRQRQRMERLRDSEWSV